MSANDAAGVRRAEKMRELVGLAEKNYRRTEESRKRWPETVVALERADDEEMIDDALAGARAIDIIFDRAPERFGRLPRSFR